MLDGDTVGQKSTVVMVERCSFYFITTGSFVYALISHAVRAMAHFSPFI